MNSSKNIISVFCIFLLFICGAKAEVATSGSFVYDKQDGEKSFMLKAPIEFVPPNLEFGSSKDWIRIRFLADIEKISTTNDTATLLAGTKIYHPRFGKEMAVVLRDVEVILSPLYNDESDKTTAIEVDGYLEMNSILGGMPIEDNLDALIKGGKCGMDYLSEHLASYFYAKWFDGGFVSYAVGGDGVRDPSPRPRIVLFFYEMKLIAISHKRDYSFSGFNANEGVRGEYISYSEYADDTLLSNFKKYYSDLMMMID